jgi:hypothetical protein
VAVARQVCYVSTPSTYPPLHASSEYSHFSMSHQGIASLMHFCQWCSLLAGSSSDEAPRGDHRAHVCAHMLTDLLGDLHPTCVCVRLSLCHPVGGRCRVLGASIWHRRRIQHRGQVCMNSGQTMAIHHLSWQHCSLATFSKSVAKMLHLLTPACNYVIVRELPSKHSEVAKRCRRYSVKCARSNFMSPRI